MAQTVSRTKKFSVDELRTMLRGVTWRSFVSMHDVPNRQRASIQLGGIVFHARYGYFLKMTGVGLVAQKQLLRFVPCWCPVRDDMTNSDIIGNYDPPWDSLHKLDLEFGAHESSHENLILKAFKGSDDHPLRADDPVLGTGHAS